jgi:competence CoiA-like predicted nuclease
MFKERSIPFAFDKISGEILDADQVFHEKKDGFQIRKQFHKDEVELYCCECEQKLNVSTSKYDRLHFKHQPKSDNCILKDEDLSREELEKIVNIIKSKESDRHKELKNKIAQLLTKVEGVKADSITVDNKFIIKGGDKRRPDVYCQYLDKELVFEIQLSELSLRYIINRYDFYRAHGMFLIWILDNFDIHGQSQFEKDIKYLTEYQNFFKLDENQEEFRLMCDYKYVFLTPDKKLLTKWTQKSVELREINFSYDSYQIYYYNFGLNKVKLEEKRYQIIEAEKEAEKHRIEQEKVNNATRKVGEIINRIKEFKKKHAISYFPISGLIKNLDDYEISVLNEKLNLRESKKNGKPPINSWINTATQEDWAFLDFILNANSIDFDVNALDQNGVSALQELIINKNLKNTKGLAIVLFERGCNLRPEDDQFLFEHYQMINKKDDLDLFRIANRLTKRQLTHTLFARSSLIFILESLKIGQIIGFSYKPTEWIAFANNAIEHYKEYWNIIQLAFKRFGQWDKLILLDKKGTFQKKLKSINDSMPPQNTDCDELIQALYPELF